MFKRLILCTMVVAFASASAQADITTSSGVLPKNKVKEMVKKYPNVVHVDHPLIQHKLSIMRDKETSTNGFRQLLREITLLLGYEVTRDFPLHHKKIETPLESYDAPFIKGKKVAIVPILRAGLGMSDGLLDLIPSARVGHVGLYRDEKTKKPVEYYVKLPEVKDRTFIVADPMLATGGSVSYAINAMNKRGVRDENIRLVTLVSAPEGIEFFAKEHPKVKIYTASIDRDLNEIAYIRPGLGDAGDRLFGTK